MSLNFFEILRPQFPSIALLLIKTIWPLLLFAVIIIIFRLTYAFYKRFQFQKAGMYEIDKMSGEEFERYLAVLFQNLGYKTQIVGSHRGDYGTDLIIEKDGTRIAVQAKCWHNSVGVKAVQEIYGSLNYYNCQKARVVTNNYFSSQAMRLARSNNVELWDRNYLAKIILSTKSK